MCFHAGHNNGEQTLLSATMKARNDGQECPSSFSLAEAWALSLSKCSKPTDRYSYYAHKSQARGNFIFP